MSAVRRARMLRAVLTSRAFHTARSQAAAMIRDPRRLQHVVSEASSLLSGTTDKGNALDAVRSEAGTLLRMARAYATGEYRDLPPTRAILLFAGLVYLVSPVDLIPDRLPGGFIDDATVIAWTSRTLRAEIARFRRWEGLAVEGRVLPPERPR